MALSLRSSLMGRLLWPMLALSLLGGAVSYVLALRFADETYDQWLLDSARSLSQQVEVADNRVRLDLPRSAMNMLVWDAYDTVLFRVDSSLSGLIGGERVLPPPPADDRIIHFYEVRRNGVDMRAVRVLLKQVVGDEDVSVTVAETLNKRRRLADRILIAVLVPEALLIALTLLLVRSGVSRGLTPISTLEANVKARRADDLTPLPDAAAPGELLPFTQAINDLLARLALAMGAQRRFIADAAHQLRTPLAALKVEVEHAVRETDPQRHAAALASLRNGIDRVSRLSNQLLLLARAEQGLGATSTRTTLDLRELAYEVASTWIPRALASKVDLGFEGDEHALLVGGDKVLLGEMLNNLIDNALRYAGDGSRITVRVGAGPVLEVEDNGPGIPQAEREVALGRFNRLPGSPGDGSGLGLAIVRDIAAAHDAQVELDDAAGGGLLVRIRFPAIAAGATAR